MLVETDAVMAEPIHFLPGFEMFGVGSHRHVCLEVSVRQGIGELASDFEMVELFAVCEQIEDENLHGRFPYIDIVVLPIRRNLKGGRLWLLRQ
jgi:hypothetical protein